MNLVCLVLVACVVIAKPEPGKARVSCEVAESSCAAMDEDEETTMRKTCEGRADCHEFSPRIFVLRRMVAEKDPSVTKL